MLPALMLGDYSMRASLTPSCFLYRTDLLGNLFLITSLINLCLFLSLLDHHTGHPTHHMLGYYYMSASLMPSEFFHRHFDLLEARFL
jgi:hypothetical protein